MKDPIENAVGDCLRKYCSINDIEIIITRCSDLGCYGELLRKRGGVLCIC